MLAIVLAAALAVVLAVASAVVPVAVLVIASGAARGAVSVAPANARTTLPRQIRSVPAVAEISAKQPGWMSDIGVLTSTVMPAISTWAESVGFCAAVMDWINPISRSSA